MAMNDGLTTLVCLFHHQDQARAALEDILKAGVPQASVSQLGGPGSQPANVSASLEELGVPRHDQQHLLDGVTSGGVIIAVSAIADHAGKVEDIFESHKASKIDEAALDQAPLGAATTQGEAVIPIVEEELLVGKRTVDQGGVRVYRRVVEVPVQESVTLREEHVSVERHAVDRPVTDQDAAFVNKSIELTETAEEAVVGKNARVVEEVLVGKQATERTEHIEDTVRHTEVEFEEVAPEDRKPLSNRGL